MRGLAFVLCLSGCAQEEPDPRTAECPYDLSRQVDVESDDPSFEEFIETAPEVDAEVARIDGVIRGGCSAIASDLGADASALGTIGACELAASLVQAVVASNPDVAFSLEYDPETYAVSLSWEGSPADRASVETLVASYEEHLDEVLEIADAAEVQEQIAGTTQRLGASISYAAEHSVGAADCIRQAVDVYMHAEAVCIEYTAAAASFTAAIYG